MRPIFIVTMTASIFLACPAVAEHEQDEDSCASYEETYFTRRVEFQRRFEDHERLVLDPLRQRIEEAEGELGDYASLLRQLDDLRGRSEKLTRQKTVFQGKIDAANRKKQVSIDRSERERAAAAALAAEAQQEQDEKKKRTLQRQAQAKERRAEGMLRPNRERDRNIAGWVRRITGIDRDRRQVDEKIGRLQRQVDDSDKSQVMRRLEQLRAELDQEQRRQEDARQVVDQAKQTYRMCQSVQELQGEIRQLRDENRRLREQIETLRGF